jgi:hypothetical protein
MVHIYGTKRDNEIILGRVQADKRTENVTSNKKIKINHKPY